MKKSWRRLSILSAVIPLLLLSLAQAYRVLMFELEHKQRSYLHSLEWAAETLTSTGYGTDGRWDHPVMVLFVILTQFLGQGFVLVVFPFVVLPFFEERFELRLPHLLPKLDDFVFVYRHGAAVDFLVNELEQHGVPVVVFEEDEATARRLRERGRRVVYGRFDEAEPDLSGLKKSACSRSEWSGS